MSSSPVSSSNASPGKRLLRFPATIAFRLPFLVISGLMVTLFAAVLVSIFVGRAQVERLAQESLESIAGIQAEQLSRQLDEQLNFLRNLAAYETIHNDIKYVNATYETTPGGPDALRETLRQEWAAAQKSHFDPAQIPPTISARIQLELTDELHDALLARPSENSSLVIVDRYGALVGYSYPPAQVFFDDAPWWQALQSGQPAYIAGPLVDLGSPTSRVLALAVPILDAQSGELMGAIYEAFDYNAITATLLRGQFSGSGRTALVAANGDVIYASIRIDDFVQANVPIAAAAAGLTTYTGQFGRTYLFVAAPVAGADPTINNLGWYAAAVQGRADALAAVNRTVAPSFGLAALIALVLIALLYIQFIRPLTRDLAHLQQGAEALQQGQQQDVIINRPDELGLLATTFNKMAYRLRHQLETQESIIAHRTAELKQRATQLRAAVQVGQAASASLDLETLMADVVDLIPDRFGFYHAAIFLLEADGQAAIVRAATGEVGQIMAAQPHRLAVGSASIVGWAMANRRPRIALNVGEDTVYFQNPLLPETRAEMAVPLVGRGDLLGALDVQSREESAFTDEDLQVLQLMADQIAAAILNARAFRQVEVQAGQLQYVLTLGQQLNRLHDDEEMVWRACRHIQEAFNYDAVHIAARGDFGWSVQAATARQPRLVAPLHLTRPLRSGLLGQAMQQGKPLLVGTRTHHDAGYYDLDFPVVGGEAAVPLYAGTEPYGAIGIYTEQPGQLTTSDLNLLALCAETIGAAIANARLLARVEQNLAELNRLYQQATRLAPATSPPDGTSINSISAFTTPLVSRGQIIGELRIGGEAEDLSPYDQNLVAAVAGQIALTVENSRLFTQTQSRLRETEALYQLTHLLSTTLDVEEIYRRAARAFTEQLGASRCLIASWEAEADTITVQAEHAANTLAHNQQLPAYSALALNDFPSARQALATQEPVARRIDDPRLPVPEEELLRRMGQVNVLLVPLLFAGEASGLVILFNQQRPFSSAETRLISALANQTTIALRNALLATETRNRVTQLTTLYRVGQRLAQAPTLQAVYDGARREILALTEATEMSVYLAQDGDRPRQAAYHYQYGIGTDRLDTLSSKPFNDDLSAYVTRQEAVVIVNAGSHAHLRRLIPEHIPPTLHSAWAGFPLIVANRCIGVLALAHDENVAAFPTDEASLLETIAASLAVAINNQLQLEQTRQALQAQTAQGVQLQAAAQVAAAASSILDPEILLQSAVDLLQTTFELYYVGIFLVDAAANEAVLRGATGEAGRNQLQEAYRLPLGPGSLIGNASADGRARVVPDVRQNPEWRPNPFLPLTRSELALPLRVRERVIGALTVQSEHVNHFTTQLVQTLQTIADQLAIAIDNGRLLQDSILYSTQLQLAAEISRAASTILDRDQLIGSVVNLIQEQFDLYYVGLFLVDKQGMAVLQGGTGSAGAEHLRQGLRFPVLEDPPPELASLVGVSIARGTTLVEEDVRQARYWTADPLLPRTRSELSLQLHARGRIIGAISAQSDQLGGFSAESISVLQSLADQIAITIENADLFAQTERSLLMSTALYETGRQVTEATDALTIYQSLVDFAATAEICDAVLVIAPDPLSPEQLLVAASWNRAAIATDDETRLQREHFPHGNDGWGTRIIHVTNGQEDERLDASLHQLFQRLQVRGADMIPILVEAEWLATLILARAIAASLPDRNLQPFLTLADQTATHLANQRLLAETNALYRISGELNQALTQEDALDMTVSAVAAYTGVPQCRFVLYDEQSGTGSVAAEFTRGQEEGPHLGMTVVEAGFFAELARRRELMIFEDTGEESAAVVAHLRPFAARAGIFIPAFSQQQFIGYLALDLPGNPQSVNRSSYNYTQAVIGQLTTFLENLRLLDDTMRSAHELVTLNQIGTHISGILNLPQLAETVNAQLGRLLPNDAFLMALYRANTQTVQTLLCHYQGETVPLPPRTLRAEEPLYTFLHGLEPIIIAGQMPLARAESEHWGRPSLPSSIWSPLLREGVPIGYISVHSRRPRAYLPNHMQLLRTIATQTSLAVSNAQLFQQTQQNVAELRKLLRVSQAAASSVEADERIRNTVSALHDSLNKASVAIYILDESRQELHQIAARGSHTFSAMLSAEHGLPRQVLSWGEPIIVNDARASGGGTGPRDDSFSQLLIPLALGRRMIGIIYVQSQQSPAFSDDDVRLLQTLSGNLATTIESGRLFQEIQAANERLREVDRLKTQFLANMSHELRTPLNSIIGFSRLMLKGIDGPITPEQEEDLSSIHTSGQHLLRLINDILDMSKIEAGKMVLILEQVDLVEVARNVLASISALLAGKPVTLQTVFAPDLPTIEADPIRMRQILLNLLSNAAKFTDAGTIQLHIQRENDTVHLQVADTGKGIAEKDFDKLFREFEQVDASPTREVGGTGLGLPITKNLVTMHGGEIWVESVLERGSTFHVRLPIRQSNT